MKNFQIEVLLEVQFCYKIQLNLVINYFQFLHNI